MDIILNQVPNEWSQKKQAKTNGHDTDIFRNLLSMKISSAQIPVSDLEKANPETDWTDMIPELKEVTHIATTEHLTIQDIFSNNMDEHFVADKRTHELFNEVVEKVSNLLNDEELEGQLLIDMLTPLIEKLGLSIEDVEQIIPSERLGQDQASKTNEHIVMQQFNELFAQVHSFLSDIHNEEELMKVAPKILQLIKKWMTLEHVATKEGLQLQEQSLSTEAQSSREQSIWKELIQTYQKRNQLVTNQHYQSDANVTSKDIAKWLSTALQTNGNQETGSISQGISITNMPMTELEQYVIHMNQAKGTHAAGKQLMEQFQNILKTSRFLSNNGVNQLSIALRPNNMGELLVRFTEINGEMTVKIITSSSMTRHMLESNMHELRHMFSPQQVVIEEQELDVQDMDKTLRDESFHDDEDQQPNHSGKDDKNDSESDFETRFLDLLMNEKV